MMESTSDEISKTNINVPVTHKTESDPPDTPMTTVSDVIGSNEALQQESVSRELTAQIRQARLDAESKTKAKAKARTPKTSARQKHQARFANNNQYFPPMDGYVQHFNDRKQWPPNQVNTQHPNQHTTSSPHQGLPPHQHILNPFHNMPFMFTPQPGPQHHFGNHTGNRPQYHPAWQQPAHPTAHSSTIPNLNHRDATKAAVEDEYDRSRGAYFRHLPPRQDMILTEPKRGIVELARNDITSMKANFGQVATLHETATQVLADNRATNVIEEGITSGPEEYGVASLEVDKVSTPMTAADKKKATQKSDEADWQNMEEKLKGVDKRLEMLDGKLDRVLQLLEGAPGPAMESGGVDGWWKEVKGEK